MRALLKVMETSTPAPEDVNTLLVLTRELTKQIPEGSSFLPTFNGFNVGDMGLPAIEKLALYRRQIKIEMMYRQPHNGSLLNLGFIQDQEDHATLGSVEFEQGEFNYFACPN